MQREHKWTARAGWSMVLVGLLLTHVSCKSSDAPTEPQPTPPLSLSGDIGPAGGNLSSADGRLQLSIPANAVGTTTTFTLEEIDVANAPASFDGFDARVALQFRSGTTLAQPATLSWSGTLERRNKPQATDPSAAAQDEETEWAEMFLGLLEGDEGSILIPDQEIEYDFNTESLDIRVRIGYTGNVVLGNPLQPDIPEPGDDYGYFGLGGIVLDPSVWEDTPFETEQKLRVSFRRSVDAAQMTSIDPPTLDLDAGVPDGDPIPSVIDELSDGTRRHTMKPGYTPRRSGRIDLPFNLQFDLQYEPEELDLPDNLDPTTHGPVRVTLRYKYLELDAVPCPEPPCQDDPPNSPLTIVTGMQAQQGLSVAFWDGANDPAPVGSGPWLYVTGESHVRWYRLEKNDAGTITATAQAGEIAWIDSRGTVPVAQGFGGRVRCLYLFGGSAGGWRTHWNDQTDEYGAIVLVSGTVLDASSYDNTSNSRGWVHTNGATIRFVEYLSSDGFYSQPVNSTLTLSAFPDAVGVPATVAVTADPEDALIVMDGNPAQVWYHNRSDVSQEGDLIGVAQNGAKQIRTQNGIFAISNHASNSVTLGTWSGAPALRGSEAVGNGPWGIDVMGLASGGAAVVTTSATDNTYTVLVVDGAGGVTSKETMALPSGCAAQYAVFVPGKVTYLAFSCAGSGTVQLQQTSLQAALPQAMSPAVSAAGDRTRR